MGEIAREAGCSSGVLVYYFGEKADLLIAVLRAAHEEVRSLHAREASGSRRTGLVALREYMLACLPLDSRRRKLAAVELAFWGEAIGNRTLLDVNDGEIDRFNDQVREWLKEARANGELAAGIDIDVAVQQVRTLIDGLSIQSVVYRGCPGPEQQTVMLDALIDGLRAQA